MTPMMIKTAEDLAVLLDRLAEEAAGGSSGWENGTLDRFLEAMAAWTRSMENYSRNTGDHEIMKPSWNTFAKMLLAARVYE